MSKHSELPWHIMTVDVGERDYSILCKGVCKRGSETPIASSSNNREQDANLEFIVRACNSHYDLLEALEELLDAETAEFPPASEGQQAQDDWATRKANARKSAQAAIKKAKPE